MPYIYTEDGFSEDEEEYNQMPNEERLAHKNKKYMTVLKKASVLYRENKMK